MCMELKVLNSLCYFCAGNDVWKICVRIGGFSVLRLMHKYSLGESDACSRVDCLKHFRSWPENQIIGPGYRGLRLRITRFFLYHMVSQYFHGTKDVHHHDTLMAPRNPVFASNLSCFPGWRENNRRRLLWLSKIGREETGKPYCDALVYLSVITQLLHWRLKL